MPQRTATPVQPDSGSAQKSSLPALEKVPSAAARMACSINKVYREVKAGRLGPLVKLGARASALPSTSVDNWILSRIAEASAVPKQSEPAERGRLV